MSNTEAFFSEMLQISSRFFLQLHDTCEKYRTNLNPKHTSKKKRSPIREDSSPEEDHAPVKQTKTKKKAYDPLKEDPNAPKKPITQAYLLYFTEVRSKMQQLNPEKKSMELTKLIGEEWNALTKEKKMRYNVEAAENKKRYEKDLTDYLDRNPDLKKKIEQSKLEAKERSKTKKTKKVQSKPTTHVSSPSRSLSERSRSPKSRSRSSSNASDSDSESSDSSIQEIKRR